MVDALEAVTLIVDGNSAPGYVWCGISLNDRMIAEIDFEILCDISPGLMFHSQIDTRAW